MPNQSTPTTTNRGYKKPGNTAENQYGFLVGRISDAIDAIDADVHGNVTDLTALTARVTTNEGDITTLENGLAAEIVNRSDGDLNLEFTKVSNTYVYDGSGRVTSYVSGNKTVSNITYNGTNGRVESWREVITLDAGDVTRDYTVTYNGNGDVTAIAFTTP